MSADVVGAVADVAAVQPITVQYHVVATNHSSVSSPEQLLPVAEWLGALCGVVHRADRLAQRGLHHGQLGQVQVGLLGVHAAPEILSLLVQL